MLISKRYKEKYFNDSALKIQKVIRKKQRNKIYIPNLLQSSNWRLGLDNK